MRINVSFYRYNRMTKEQLRATVATAVVYFVE